MVANDGIGKDSTDVNKLDSVIAKDGSFNRPESQFRNWISNDPNAEFPAERDRYHLYVSYACPWAHRTLIVRKLKGLEAMIPFTSVHWQLTERGWPFASAETADAALNVTPDPHHPDATHISYLYYAQQPEYSGRSTVPVLFDKIQSKIVSNESAEIIRMMYHSFDHLLPAQFAQVDLLPQSLLPTIDETNDWIYHNINNGVYKAGIANTQSAYEIAVNNLFSALDRVEKHLQTTSSSSVAGPFFHGDQITESDIRLYPTIVRFDPVYVQHFKCNIRDIRSGYPAIHRWLRHCYWNVAAFRETTNFPHIKQHYTKSHKFINPYGITPVGPVPDILALDDEVAAAAAVAGRGKL